MHYDQYMALCYLMTFKFSDFDQFLDKVNEYIVTYKNMVNGKYKNVNESDSEEETEEEGPMIEIDIKNINLNDVTIMNDDEVVIDLNDDMI
jgi:hypothetical protein